MSGDRRRKVLHIHLRRQEGGAERFFVNLATALHSRNVEQRFVVRHGLRWHESLERVGQVVLCKYRHKPVFGLLLNYQLRRMVARWQPDAIMAWMAKSAPLIPNMSGPVKLVRLGDFPKDLSLVQNCDLLVSNTPGIGECCRALGWDRPVYTISNFPRDLDCHPIARSALDTPEDAFVISGAGRFVPHKKFDLLIRAADRVPGAYLWLVGDGKERLALEALAREEGIWERCRFVGWVDDTGPYIAASDAFAMPSRREPLGNVVLEAWALGTPTVATRSEGPSWYMTDGENGCLVDINDLDGFTAALKRIRDDRAFAEALVAGAHAQLQAMFTRESIVDQYLQLFDGAWH